MSEGVEPPPQVIEGRGGKARQRMGSARARATTHLAGRSNLQHRVVRQARPPSERSLPGSNPVPGHRRS
eukprot:12148921-Alexandrium_andersonii.AAC.1